MATVELLRDSVHTPPEQLNGGFIILLSIAVYIVCRCVLNFMIKLYDLHYHTVHALLHILGGGRGQIFFFFWKKNSLLAAEIKKKIVGLGKKVVGQIGK